MKIIPTFKALLKIAAKKDIRYYLKGIHVFERNDKVFIEVTDGHTLVRIETINCEFLQVAPNIDVILYRDSVEKICKFYGKNDEPTLKIDTDGVSSVKLNGLPFTIDTTIDGRFPDCDRVIPTDKRYKRDTNTKGFNVAKLSKVCKCCEDVLKINGMDKFQGAKFDLFTPSDAMVITQEVNDIKLTAVIMPVRL